MQIYIHPLSNIIIHLSVLLSLILNTIEHLFLYPYLFLHSFDLPSPHISFFYYWKCNPVYSYLINLLIFIFILLLFIQNKNNVFFLCQIHYTGSHFDRLKVGDRQEYDINIILYTPDQLTVRSGCKDLPNFMSFASKARCGGSGKSIWATVNER